MLETGSNGDLFGFRADSGRVETSPWNGEVAWLQLAFGAMEGPILLSHAIRRMVTRVIVWELLEMFGLVAQLARAYP